ncbi:Aconitate hydratase precursor [Anatilimnocola aggregata]|uniref:Aconitate hydratase n=1 Tax=Anatilimnocola aggregata TaxID=2528021 RepID=A0A517YCJ1_9BACT|nr:aconitate hydratase AcnA [Anatilimnocola aggregata]QDU27948.1 Aconitate hydratase precursor [Anatilimnocola aggregata]
MTNTVFDPFGSRDTFSTGSGEAGIYRLSKLEQLGLGAVSKLPFSIRILLEAALRNCDGYIVTEDDVKALASWNAAEPAKREIPFMPSRVVLQDFTGVPCVVDLAAMRSAMQRLGGDPKKINPLIPVDLVIDHSVQVDFFGTSQSLGQNVDLEFKRNRERYEFLRWGQRAFNNFRVVPPDVGIVHQVNLEYLAKGVFIRSDKKGPVALPDSLVGTDSHTTMINGLGVLGWGVGGIEAEAVMLGQPLYMLLPEVIGFELTGELQPGVTATDLVLTVTQQLRKVGVVDKFVEFYGSGARKMSLADRATIANMAPEYGATMGFFPIDDETLSFLQRTGRTAEEVSLVERYCKEQGLFNAPGSAELNYTKKVSLDLGTVEPSLAGPKRPQDRVSLASMKSNWQKSLKAPVAERGFQLDEAALNRKGTVQTNGHSETIGHGAVVIAAITSCTNTSNPSVMLAAGLLAKKAVAKGLKVPSYVKTSLAPGSRVVTDYFDRAGVSQALDTLGFQTVGYGCTTCIGNSGPLPDNVAAAVQEGDLVASAVISGNRNFEGRVNPLVKANFLASPPLVVAYALAGTTDIDLINEPIGEGTSGPVMLKDIWPTHAEVRQAIADFVQPEMFSSRYARAFDGNNMWNAINVAEGALYNWNGDSTYIQEPPFLDEFSANATVVRPIRGARVLAMLGDSVTTDHISPAGNIAKNSPAGKFLMERGVEPVDFNSYGARRGNDRVMVRGTFANVRIRNFLAPGTEGGVTKYLGAGHVAGKPPVADADAGQVMFIYDAAMKYRATGTPTIILAGAEYGTGSSRDWAAKGTNLLGVRAVIAASYERIHRSNLVNMGVLPLQFLEGQTWKSLGIVGDETFEILGLDESLSPRSQISVQATSPDGTSKTFAAAVRIDTPVELDYYRNGGILQTVVKKLMAE